MPPTPLTHRPQTLKQAKRAYRKSGGTVRLSESEKAMLERRAVLQERADRIKEREARRKANLKRKEERVQREREARHRMGIPSPPPKEGIHVGPSQLHLSGFIYAGGRMKREEEEKEEKKDAGIIKQGEMVVEEQYGYQTDPPRLPQTPQASCPDTSPGLTTPSHITNENSSNVQKSALQRNGTLTNWTPPTRSPLQSKSVNLTMKPKPSADNKHAWGVLANASNVQKPQPWPLDPKETQTISFRKSRFMQPPPKPEPFSEDNLDDFFVTNTQIQRELSPPFAPPTISPLHNITTLRSPPKPAPPLFKPYPTDKDKDTADLLSLISTQDLDFSFDPTQINPAAALDNEPEVSSISEEGEKEEEKEEGEEEEDFFPDSELEEIVLEFSLESPIKSSSSTSSSSSNPKPPQQNPSPNPNPNPNTRPQSDSNCYSSSLSDTNKPQANLQPASQKDRYERKEPRYHEEEAQEAAEWDIFDMLSTQDIMELAS